MNRLWRIALGYVVFVVVLWLGGFGGLLLAVEMAGDAQGMASGFRWPEALLSAASAATCNGLLVRPFDQLAGSVRWVLLGINQLGAVGAIVASASAVESAMVARGGRSGPSKSPWGIGWLGCVAVVWLALVGGVVMGGLRGAGVSWEAAVQTGMSAAGLVGWGGMLGTGSVGGTVLPGYGFAVLGVAGWLAGLGVLAVRHGAVRRAGVTWAVWALVLGTAGVGISQMVPHWYEATTSGAQKLEPMTGTLALEKLTQGVYAAGVGGNHAAWWPGDVERPASLVVEMGLMLVGGVPGSPAGGVVLAAAVLAAVGLGRSAGVYLAVMGGVIGLGFWALTLTEAETYFAWGVLRPVVGAVTGGGAGRITAGDLKPWNVASLMALMLVGKVVLVVVLASTAGRGKAAG